MRLQRAIRDEVPFATVLFIVAFGFGYTFLASGHWLRGVSVMAFGMGVAAVLRMALPNGKAGLLVVRSRVFDTACYLGLGVAVFGFGILVPQ